MAIIKLVAAVKIDTQSGAATKDDEVIAEYFSAAVSVEYIMIPIRREMNREPIADAIATTPCKYVAGDLA